MEIREQPLLDLKKVGIEEKEIFEDILGSTYAAASGDQSQACKKLLRIDEQQQDEITLSVQEKKNEIFSWVNGLILLLIIANVGSMTTVGLSAVNGPINPYITRSLGFSLALGLSIGWILLRHETVTVPSSRHFFLIVGAITCLAVDDVLNAHALSFTPLHTVQGLFITWALIGSIVFSRLFCKRRLKAARVLCLGICTIGCTLVAQPEWFSELDASQKHFNHSISLNEDHYVEINANTVIPLIHRPKPRAGMPSLNMTSLKIPLDSMRYGDYIIGCILASVSGVFNGAWLTIVYFMTDTNLSTLIFWPSLSCSLLSIVLLFCTDYLYSPHCIFDLFLLVFEAVGKGLSLVATGIAVRLTNPIITTSMLSLSLLLNYIAVYLPTGHYNGYFGHYRISWTEILGCVILVTGIIFSLVLEARHRFLQVQRKEITTRPNSKKKDKDNKPSCSFSLASTSETFV